MTPTIISWNIHNDEAPMIVNHSDGPITIILFEDAVVDGAPDLPLTIT